jgi:hypothetical protein
MSTPVENSVSSFTFARVDHDTLEVTLKYNTNGGPKWAEGDLECLIPFDVLAYQAVLVDDVVTLLEDPAKVQAKLDAQWTSVRAQQKQKLYESDWTCSVIDPPPEILAQRDQWLQYRADLRAVTTQSDPFAIVWPLEPVVETPVVQVAEPVVESVQEVTEAEPVVEVAEPVVEVTEPVPEVTEPVTEVPAVVEVTEVPAVVEVTEPQ